MLPIFHASGIDTPSGLQNLQTWRAFSRKFVLQCLLFPYLYFLSINFNRSTNIYTKNRLNSKESGCGSICPGLSGVSETNSFQKWNNFLLEKETAFENQSEGCPVLHVPLLTDKFSELLIFDGVIRSVPFCLFKSQQYTFLRTGYPCYYLLKEVSITKLKCYI